MDVTKEVDVVVIGAGMSGLSAANELKNLTNDSIEVLVLEAADRIGGRVTSVKLPAAHGEEYFDLGGQWAAKSQKHLLKLLEEFNCETSLQRSTGVRTLVINNLSDIRTYSGTIPNLGILELLDSYRMQKKVESMWKQISVENPLTCKFAREWDSTTMESYFNSTCRTEATRNIMYAIARALFGSEASQVSLFFFLYYCAEAGGLEALMETNNGGQELLVKGSMGQVAVKVQEKIGKDRVILGDPVVAIDQSDQSSVILKTEKGRTYRAKYIISAIPPRLVNKIRFHPQLPLTRIQLGERMPMGQYMKVLATYEKDFWTPKNSCAEATAIANKTSAYPLFATFDITSPATGAPAILGFIGGEHVLVWRAKPPEQRKEEIIECLVGIFGEEAKTCLIHYEEKDWTKEPYVGGCPTSIMAPGCLTYFHHALREPFDRIHWAGTEVALEWTGYINGAVEAGYRAAKEIAERMKSPSTYPPSKLEGLSPLLPQGDSWKATSERKSLLRYFFR